jgi:hypothetical protein
MRFPFLLLFAALLAAQPPLKTRNVILVMTDGLRLQEVFTGADPALLNKEHGAVSDVPALEREFWRDSPEARRRDLLPFLWTTVASHGQIYGNRARNAPAYVTNGLNFSYPGYNETLTGFADPRINSNDKVPNPNVTVFEWLHRQPAFQGKVAAFAAWDTFPAIFNAPRARFPVNAAADPFTLPPISPTLQLLNRLKAETPAWPSETFDSFTFHTALEYLKLHQPRLLFLSLGETDEFAHEGRYDYYLHSAHRVDRYLRELWNTLQSLPQYRDSTTLIFTTDHGRGDAPVAWRSHGQKIPDSRFIWLAAIGPDTPALGERANIPAITQSQIAATIAALLGADYLAAEPRAGKPIADLLPSASKTGPR